MEIICKVTKIKKYDKTIHKAIMNNRISLLEERKTFLQSLLKKYNQEGDDPLYLSPLGMGKGIVGKINGEIREINSLLYYIKQCLKSFNNKDAISKKDEETLLKLKNDYQEYIKKYDIIQYPKDIRVYINL